MGHIVVLTDRMCRLEREVDVIVPFYVGVARRPPNYYKA